MSFCSLSSYLSQQHTTLFLQESGISSEAVFNLNTFDPKYDLNAPAVGQSFHCESDLDQILNYLKFWKISDQI